MIIKQQINHGAIQRVSHLYNDIFHPVHLCHIYSPDNIDSMTVSAYHVISKELENRIFRHDHKELILTK